MTGDLFNSESIAGGKCITWHGQIVDDTAWRANETRKLWNNPNDLKGFGSRYKVRIMGRDDVNKCVPDQRCVMADVLYPVTSGSGGASSYQTCALKKGDFVFGFYRDGIDMSEPVIIGVWGNNDQTRLSAAIPSKGLVPFSAYAGDNVVPFYATPSTNPGTTGGAAPTIEANSASTPSRNNIANIKQAESGKEVTPLDSPSRCESAPLGKIQKKIQQLIKDIERFQKNLNSWETTISSPIHFKGQQLSPQQYINQIVSDATEAIASGLKWVIDWVRNYVIRKVNNTLKDTYYLIFPNKRDKVKKAQETALDLLSCLFNKIISNLLQMIGKFLLQCVDRFINTPLCAVENFVGGLLGKLGGLISGFVDKILGPIQSLVGSIFSLAGSILGILKQILGFFTCEEEGACNEVKEWSIWDGAGSNSNAIDIDVTGIFDAAAKIGAGIAAVSDPNNFDFGAVDFSDIFQDTCNVGPVFCGPPKVSFYGGGGSGAAGNAIISAAGDLLGVNITAPGFNYTSAPAVSFYDNCGNGDGAVGQAVLGPVIVPGTTPVTGNDGGGGDGTSTDGGEVTDGGTGAGTTSVTAGGDPVVAGTCTVIVAGNVRITTGNKKGTPVLAGATGGIPVTCCNNQRVTAGGRGGTPVTSKGLPVTANGIPLVCGGTGGTPVTLGGTGGTPVTVGITSGIGIVDVIITDPGFGYLPKPDGSIGGDGRTWAVPGDTVIKREDGTYDPPYKPGEDYTVKPGDTVTTVGLNTVAPEFPGLDNGSYPVILSLCKISVINPGFRYSPNDKVVISPSNGAVATAKFGPNGSISSVEIVKVGTAYTEAPRIYMQTETGYNAKLVPVFCLDRIGNVTEDDLTDLVQDPTEIIHVIDCVGRV